MHGHYGGSGCEPSLFTILEIDKQSVAQGGRRRAIADTYRDHRFKGDTMTRLFTFIAALVLTSSVALAVPHVPGRGPLKGDIVKMNQQFHLNGFNYRVESIRWIPATDPYAQKAAPYAGNATAPNGFLVFEVPVKNANYFVEPIPNLIVTAFYKDGTSKDSDGPAHSKAGPEVNASEKLYPGQGVTVYYVLSDVPQPSSSNPLTKLILKNNLSNPGYPPVYRLLHPVVHP
ncbi:MAG: hypothetical protein ACYDHD_07930 [Vulcanimicrobiaceae bacterium]